MESAQSGAPFNRDELWERVHRDGALLHEIVELFLELAPKTLRAIREAIAFGHGEILERASHELKGELAVFGAEHAFECARSLEEMGRWQELYGATEVCDQLDAEVARLQQSLADLKDATPLEA